MDKGHENLIKEIKSLLSDAEDYQFHDFCNSRYPAPKRVLRTILLAMVERVEEGAVVDLKVSSVQGAIPCHRLTSSSQRENLSQKKGV